MKYALMVLLLVAGAAGAVGTHPVKGYTRKDGTYVAPHVASNPNAYRYDNLNSQSNGGTQRDEYSEKPATNKSNPAYGSMDNDSDGVPNASDSTPDSSDSN